jgi:hypothetical protein
MGKVILSKTKFLKSPINLIKNTGSETMNRERTLKNPTKAIRTLMEEGMSRFTVEELNLGISKKFDIPLSTNLNKSLYQAAKRLAVKGELQVGKTKENRIQYRTNDEVENKKVTKTEVSGKETENLQQISEIRATLIDSEDEYFTKMEAANFCLKQIALYPQFTKKLTELHQTKRHESLIALARTEVLNAMLEGN